MSMSRLTPLLALAAFALVACNTYDTPRPFAGRGGRSLDQPPRYGDPNRYVEPIAPPPGPMIDPNGPVVGPDGPITPGTIPPITTPGTPGVDPGLTVTPPGTAPVTPPPGGVVTPPAPGTTPPSVAPPAPGDVPFARAVPGKPGYVYSPKDPKKVISVEGLRPGSKAKDPETGEIFRVPYQ
jgi:hypothetical protein